MSSWAWPAPNAPTFFLALCVYRILNALLIQTQFDPDEYWQTLEPAYCQAFASPCAYTWEWTRRHGDTGTGTASGRDATTLLTTLLTLWEQSLHGPVRSFLSVLPTYVLYSVANYARWDTWWVISKGPMVLHAILVAAPTDYAVYNIAHLVYHDHGGNAQQYARWALLLSASSWFHGYALIRTYSNSVETMLLMVGLNLVAPDLYRSPDRDGKSLRVPCWHAAVAFVLGGMSVAIRFTSLAAWVPLGILLARKKQSTLYYLIRPCALFGLTGLGISLVVDRYFFGFWVLPVLGSFQFNVVEGHGSLYGTHPWYWYLIAGLPAICGLSLPLVLISIRQSVTGTSTTTTTARPLWIIICSYTVLHSCSAHKEFRFLLPILPLLHIVSASAAVSVVQGKRNRLLWLGGVYVVVNLIAVLYLGVMHQAGPVAIQRGLVQHVAMSTSTTSPRTVTVHYWMSCHSTPLYSHLHHQRTTTTMMTTTLLLEAWYLDCSPSCRMHPPAGGGCESDAFQSDPRSFVRNKYMRMQGESACQEEGDETCGGLLSQSSMVGWKVFHTSIPDYVAILSSDEMTLRNELQMMNMVQVGRYPHTLKGVRIGSLTLGSIESRQEKVLVQVSFEEMVLLRHQLNI